MIHIIWSIIVGFFIGLAAKFLGPQIPFLHLEHHDIGWVKTSLIGIGGSFVGGLIGRLVSAPVPGAKFHPAGCLMSIVGAIILLYIWSLVG